MKKTFRRLRKKYDKKTATTTKNFIDFENNLSWKSIKIKYKENQKKSHRSKGELFNVLLGITSQKRKKK